MERPRDTNAIEDGRVLDAVRSMWGFDTLRPLQGRAIQLGIEERDALVVLPTGGGKSLCYQVPPLVTGRTDIVVSPLISLMKDQVDGLLANGYDAIALHSGQTDGERNEAMARVRASQCRLIFVAPERLIMPSFLELVERLGIRSFAIDEAHCISQWGHDFRPEYRRLALLKTRFPGASVHAYTATATERVREDIAAQLGLESPEVLVGRFDRPNLVYRIVPRQDLRRQVGGVLARHRGAAGIVYCISRADTERLAAQLRKDGINAACYHAGLDPAERRGTQDAFSNESLDVVVATVAFGMGIDRSDVRVVIHAAMPKSVEHYQQETGRAGRDGLEAECVLLHSPADAMRWQSLFERSAAEAEDADTALAASRELLDGMRRFCAPGRCRHKSLSEYFGQKYDRADCEACDTCLGETEALEDGTREAQMVLSCVARLKGRFGVGYVVDVLRGAETERITSLGHEQLSTYGILRDQSKKHVTNIVYQLVDQGLLTRTGAEYPVLGLSEDSMPVLRGERTVHLVPQRAAKPVAKTRAEKEAWEDVDPALFEALRALRKDLARRRGVPPYVVFNDASLRDMVRRRPATPDEFLAVHGVGGKKLKDFGAQFMELIASHRTDPVDPEDPADLSDPEDPAGAA